MTASSKSRLAHLKRQHRGLDGLVRKLNARSYLTPGESMKATALKKLRLQAKDQISNFKQNPD